MFEGQIPGGEKHNNLRTYFPKLILTGKKYPENVKRRHMAGFNLSLFGS